MTIVILHGKSISFQTGNIAIKWTLPVMSAALPFSLDPQGALWAVHGFLRENIGRHNTYLSNFSPGPLKLQRGVVK